MACIHLWILFGRSLFCSTFCVLQCRPAVLFLAFVIDAAFALAIVGFLIMHCRMIARNMTTIEMYEKRRSATGPWQFDRGAKQNFLEVFGKRCRCCYVKLSHYALLMAHGSQSRVLSGVPSFGQWYVCLQCSTWSAWCYVASCWLAVVNVDCVCSRTRWFVPAYTKEEVRELLSNHLRFRPPDSDDAELTVSRSFSNNVWKTKYGCAARCMSVRQTCTRCAADWVCVLHKNRSVMTEHDAA